jgi:hypothetical protein
MENNFRLLLRIIIAHKRLKFGIPFGYYKKTMIV